MNWVGLEYESLNNMNRKTNCALPDTEPDRISGERRRDKRYELEMEMRWKLVRRRKVLYEGGGRTVDLSSGGMLVETDRPLPVGLNLEMAIAWPMRLQDGAPLQLVVAGKILRSLGRRAAIRMVQHEFRTAAAADEQTAAPASGTRAPLPFPSGKPEAASCGRLN